MKEQIKFQAELVKRLNETLADAGVAVAEAALSAVAQDSKITVRVFATALRTVAPMLGTSNCVLAAALKSAKEKNAELNDVTAAMAAAVAKKREDDRIRAAKKAAAKPAEDLKKAREEVQVCLLAMRSPLEVAQDDLATADAAVKHASKLLREARANRRAARAKLATMTDTKPTTTKPTTTKPTATKPAATKPAATKPAA